jgi:hypothetical protein
MPFALFRPAPVHTFEARIQRARNEGYVRGAREARLFRLAMVGAFQREQALGWLNTAVDDGRADLQAQHALEREIDAWDMSCRIMLHGADQWLGVRQIMPSSSSRVVGWSGGFVLDAVRHGVLCTLSAWVIGVGSLWLGLDAGAEATTSPRLAIVLYKKYEESNAC